MDWRCPMLVIKLGIGIFAAGFSAPQGHWGCFAAGIGAVNYQITTPFRLLWSSMWLSLGSLSPWLPQPWEVPARTLISVLGSWLGVVIATVLLFSYLPSRRPRLGLAVARFLAGGHGSHLGEPTTGKGFGLGWLALFGLWPRWRNYSSHALDLVIGPDFVFRDGLDRCVDAASSAAVVVSQRFPIS